MLDRRSDFIRELDWSLFGVENTVIGEGAPWMAPQPGHLDLKLVVVVVVVVVVVAVAGEREGVDVIDTCLGFKASPVVAAPAEGFSRRVTYLQNISLVFGGPSKCCSSPSEPE